MGETLRNAVTWLGRGLLLPPGWQSACSMASRFLFGERPPTYSQELFRQLHGPAQGLTSAESGD